ncbi:MAG: glutamate---cysteine ligase / carboxylate-amine ligase, partial [Actinomycetota bacterium]|nr:glutamate---cysteine ligase / carboxylate-amine ligase [Actinomycetota bacterium]
IREVWWDIRPHPDFGTVELRICDGISTMQELAGLAAMAQCLVEWMDNRLDAGEVLPVPKSWVVRQNKWTASRRGIDASVIVDDQGTLLPLRTEVERLVAELRPVAARLGCLDELNSNLAVLDHGPSYVRQRRILAAGGTLVDVVDSLVAELESGAPGAAPPAA